MRSNIFIMLILFFLFVSCDSSSDNSIQSDNGAQNGEQNIENNGENSGSNTNTPVKPDEQTLTGDSLKNYLEQLSSQCGVISSGTVPADWQIFNVQASGGCTIRAPLGWGPDYYETGILIKDPTGVAGYYVFNTYLNGTSWTPHDMSAYFVEQLKEVYGKIVVLKEEAVSYDIGGMPLNVYFTYYKFYIGGKLEVGLFKIILQDCSQMLNVCPLTVLGGYAPFAEIQNFLCTLNQIEVSLHCPSGGGGCSSSQCSYDCKEKGYSDGYCDSTDKCKCY